MTAADHAVVTFLANAAVQATLVCLAAIVAERVLRQASARERWRLWAAAVGLATVLPLVTTGAALRPVAPSGKVESATVAGSIVPVAVAVAPTVMREVRVAERTSSWIALAFGVLVAVRIARLLGGLGWVARLRRRSSPIDVGPIVDVGHTMATRLGIDAVDVHATDDLRTPATVGIRFPVVLVPRTLLSADVTTLRAVLGHELAHVRRRDAAWSLVLEAVRLPLCFHPLSALMARRLAAAREEACDELVAGPLVPRRAYVRALVDVARSLGRARPPLLVAGVFSHHSLEDRVMRLLTVRPGTEGGRRALACGAFVLGVAVAADLRVAVASGLDGGLAASAHALLGPTAPGPAVGDEGAIYDSGGRRDPFLDLRAGPKPPVEIRTASDLTIAQVALRGIVQTRHGVRALILGPDNRSWVVAVGQRFRDGSLVSIANGTATFRQVSDEPLTKGEVREVRLRLHEGT